MQIIECYSKIGLLGFVLLSFTGCINAAELLMVEQPDCPYCDRFNHEISDIYPKTAEGKRAALVRVQLYEPWPDKYNNVEKPQFTPTFILVDNGKEIDRLHGYQGDEFFWFLLGSMLEKLPEKKSE